MKERPKRTDAIPLAARPPSSEQELRTAKKLLEERSRELATTVSLLEATFQSSVDGILVIDLTGHLTTYNAKFVALWNLPDEILARNNLQEIRAFMAGQLKDAHGFFHVVHSLQGEPGQTTFNEFSLRDGRVFERVSLPQVMDQKCIGTVVNWRDITQRRNAERALRENEALWSFALEGAEDGVWDWDIENGRALFSKRWREILGYVESDITPRIEEWLTRVHPEEQARCRADLQAHHDGMTAGYNFEHRLRCKNGEWKWTLIRGKVMARDELGRPLRMTGTLSDITDRKLAEGRLSASLATIKNLEYALDEHSLVAMTDQNGIITYVNEKFCQISKYTREELLGQDHRIVNSGYHSKEYFRNLWKTISRGKVWKGEVKNRAKDGSYYWVDTTIVPFLNAAGKPYQYVAIRTDITERVSVERSLENEKQFITRISDSLPGLVSYWTHDLRCSYANHAFSQWYGIPQDKVLGMEKRAVVGEELFRQNEPHIRAALRSELQTFERTVTRPNGETAFTWNHFIPEFSDEGVKGFLSLTSDITDLKAAQNALVERNRLNALGEMAAGVAHDFNNALQGISANLELSLLDAALPPSATEYLASAQSLVTDAMARVKLLQRFGSHGASQPVHTPVDVKSLVEDTILQMRPLWKDQAESNGTYIHIQTEVDVVSQVLGNESELRTILYNVIKNSIESMPGGGAIAVDAKEQNGEIIISVSDSGRGMAAEEVQRIFQPFYTTKGFRGGMGLGMTAVWSIIQAHKGVVRIAKTVLNQGTTLEIVLPAHAVQAPPVKRTGLRLVKRPLRVLWVDDDKTITLVAPQILRSMGHTGDVAQSGEQALLLLKKETYDIVITDIGMPGMNGWELVRRIRDTHGHAMKIIALTGWGEQSNDLNPCGMKVDLLMAKPIRFESLEKALYEVSGGKPGA